MFIRFILAKILYFMKICARNWLLMQANVIVRSSSIYIGAAILVNVIFRFHMLRDGTWIITYFGSYKS